MSDGCTSSFSNSNDQTTETHSSEENEGGRSTPTEEDTTRRDINASNGAPATRPGVGSASPEISSTAMHATPENASTVTSTPPPQTGPPSPQTGPPSPPGGSTGTSHVGPRAPGQPVPGTTAASAISVSSSTPIPIPLTGSPPRGSPPPHVSPPPSAVPGSPEKPVTERPASSATSASATPPIPSPPAGPPPPPGPPPPSGDSTSRAKPILKRPGTSSKPELQLYMLLKTKELFAKHSDYFVQTGKEYKVNSDYIQDFNEFILGELNKRLDALWGEAKDSSTKCDMLLFFFELFQSSKVNSGVFVCALGRLGDDKLVLRSKADALVKIVGESEINVPPELSSFFDKCRKTDIDEVFKTADSLPDDREIFFKQLIFEGAPSYGNSFKLRLQILLKEAALPVADNFTTTSDTGEYMLKNGLVYINLLKQLIYDEFNRRYSADKARRQSNAENMSNHVIAADDVGTYYVEQDRLEKQLQDHVAFCDIFDPENHNVLVPGVFVRPFDGALKSKESNWLEISVLEASVSWRDIMHSLRGYKDNKDVTCLDGLDRKRNVFFYRLSVEELPESETSALPDASSRTGKRAGFGPPNANPFGDVKLLEEGHKDRNKPYAFYTIRLELRLKTEPFEKAAAEKSRVSKVFKLIPGKDDEYTVDTKNIDIFRSVLKNDRLKYSLLILGGVKNAEKFASLQKLLLSFVRTIDDPKFCTVNPGVFVRPFGTNEKCLQSKKDNWVQFNFHIDGAEKDSWETSFRATCEMFKRLDKDDFAKTDFDKLTNDQDVYIGDFEVKRIKVSERKLASQQVNLLEAPVTLVEREESDIKVDVGDSYSVEDELPKPFDGRPSRGVSANVFVDFADIEHERANRELGVLEPRMKRARIEDQDTGFYSKEKDEIADKLASLLNARLTGSTRGEEVDDVEMADVSSKEGLSVREGLGSGGATVHPPFETIPAASQEESVRDQLSSGGGSRRIIHPPFESIPAASQDESIDDHSNSGGGTRQTTHPPFESIPAASQEVSVRDQFSSGGVTLQTTHTPLESIPNVPQEESVHDVLSSGGGTRETAHPPFETIPGAVSETMGQEESVHDVLSSGGGTRETAHPPFDTIPDASNVDLTHELDVDVVGNEPMTDDRSQPAMDTMVSQPAMETVVSQAAMCPATAPAMDPAMDQVSAPVFVHELPDNDATVQQAGAPLQSTGDPPNPQIDAEMTESLNEYISEPSTPVVVHEVPDNDATVEQAGPPFQSKGDPKYLEMVACAGTVLSESENDVEMSEGTVEPGDDNVSWDAKYPDED
eukprot:93176_1